MQNAISFTKNILTLIALLTSFTGLNAQYSLVGTWQPEDKENLIEIYEENGKYYGKVTGSENPTEDEKIKSKIESDVMVILLKDFEKKDKKKYCCGTLFSPKKQKEMSATISIESEDKIKITVKKGFMSKSLYWHKVQS